MNLVTKPTFLQVFLIVILCAGMTSAASHAQERTITGNVVSADGGEPLPGVNIVVMGTQIGTATAVDGFYSLEGVPADADSLVYSFVGFETLVEPLDGRSVINVALQPTEAELGEVVVIGYGEKSRELLTESIGTVNAEAVEQLPLASPEQALQGRVSGVQITSTDGTPGAPVSVRIRGVGTVGNTQPLFVIDGVPVGRGGGSTTNPLSTLNPADIESISVLKDASAAAVYGVRAANGVVLIETKQGQPGEPSISFNSYYGIQRLPDLWEMNNTQQWLTITQEAFTNYNQQFGYQPSDADFRELHPDLQEGSPFRDINTDWLGDAIYRNAPIQDYNLSVSGGTQELNYYISAGYFNQEAVIDRWSLDRYTFRVNSDYQVTDWLSFGENFSLTYRDVRAGMNGGGDGFLLRNAAGMPPFFEIYDTDNSVVDNRYGFEGNFGPEGNNPRAGITKANQNGINKIVDNHNRTGRILGGINLQIDLIGGLYARSEAQLDLSYDRNNDWQPPYSNREVGLDRIEDRYSDSRSENYAQVFTNTLNYEGEIGNHSINALAGVELQRIRSTTSAASGGGFLSFDPRYRTTGNLSERINVTGGGGESDFVGFVGRVSYNYSQKYLLTTTIRRDGTSAFSPEDGRRWGIFPSVSAAWRIGEESFLQDVSFISGLKLRGSWGQLGNDQTVSYPYLFQVSTRPNYGAGETTLQNAMPDNFVNEDVTWETVETIDVGLEASFLQERLSVGATYYRRTTNDFLINVPISNVTGFGSAPVNAGSVRNTGVELDAGYFDQFGDLTLDVSANLTTVTNELTELAEGIQEFSSGGGYRTAVGFPISYFWGYKTDGLYQSEEEAAEALPDSRRQGGTDAQPGDVRFVDIARSCTAEDRAEGICSEGQAYVNETDGEITPADRTFLGKTIPDFYYGITLNAGWRQFDLGLLFQGVAGVQRYNSFRQAHLSTISGGSTNMLSESLNRWTGEGSSETIPRAVSTDPNNNFRFSDLWVEDAGYFRLKNIQLGYSLPPSLGRGTFKRARIYLSATNLLTLTPYKGLDPEVRTYRSASDQIQAGTDAGNMPNPRTYRLGLQLQF